MENVTCPNPGCGAVLGQALNIEGMLMLRTGVLLIRDLQGVCMQCGRTIYWSLSQKSVNKVIKMASTMPDDDNTETGVYRPA